MNLAQLQRHGLAALYPPLRTRSGAVIPTTVVTSESEPEGLGVLIRTVFPPSDRRRTKLIVTELDGGLHVRPAEAEGTPDAQRFAERLRDHFLQESPDEPLAPLVLVRDGEQRYGFRIARAAPRAADTGARHDAFLTEPATPAGRRATAGAQRTEKGDS